MVLNALHPLNGGLPLATGCTYNFPHLQPRAVHKIGSTVYCYDANGNMTKRAGSNITYASYNLPTVINSGSNSSTLSYGAFRNRYKQVAVTSGATETTIYVAGLFEKVTLPSGVIEYRHYIPGGNGTAAIHTRRSTGINSTFYWHGDHLGSPELFTDTGGTVQVRPSFGAYGERRDGSDWLGPPSAGDLTTLAGITRRGFTGHEHLDSVGLVHMNGRVYDPTAGRFLSRDPYIDGVFNSQGPNGYAYVHNNPLTFEDPSGFNKDKDCEWENGEPTVCGKRPRRAPPRDPYTPPSRGDGGGGGDGGGRGDGGESEQESKKVNCQFNVNRASQARTDPSNPENLQSGTYPSRTNGFSAAWHGGIQLENRYVADFTTRTVHRISSYALTIGFRGGASLQWSGGAGNRNFTNYSRSDLGLGWTVGVSFVAVVGGGISRSGATVTRTINAGADMGVSGGGTFSDYLAATPFEELPEDLKEFYEETYGENCGG